MAMARCVNYTEVYMKRQIKRASIGFVGGIVVVVGIILIPYPGPGWLVVFAGLTILSTEFDRPRHILEWLRKKYDAWRVWMEHQNPGVQILFGLGTTIIVIGTLWLLNGYGVLNDWFHLDWPWLRSPLF